MNGNDGGIPNKGEKKEFWNILNSVQMKRHQTMECDGMWGWHVGVSRRVS